MSVRMRILGGLLLLFGVSNARAQSLVLPGISVEAWSAPVVPGIVKGVSVDAFRIDEGPWSFGPRLSVGGVEAANETWKLQQVHLTALLGLTRARALGAGRFIGGLDAGGVVIREHASRHQFDRLTQAGVDDRECVAWTAGPMVRLRIGAMVEFSEAWFFLLEMGPQATYLRVNGAWQASSGVFSSAGVRHAF